MHAVYSVRNLGTALAEGMRAELVEERLSRSVEPTGHRPAWAAYNRRARKAPGAVGIWQETYLVERSESIYAGMPVSGLAAATRVVPVAERGETARERLGLRQAA